MVTFCKFCHFFSHAKIYLVWYQSLSDKISLSLFVGIQSNYLSSVFNQVFSAAGLWTKYVLVFLLKI